MARYMDAIIAGFGGQGVMLIGNLLAYAGMNDGLNVTYIPVYGPEMRGGTANCTVVLSEDDIGSPIIHHPQSVIAMNRPSVDKFQPRIVDNGVEIINSSLIDMDLADTKRLRCFDVPCNDIADKLGNSRMANMVAIGAYAQITGIVTVDALVSALENVISPRYHKLIPANTEAIKAGAAHVA